MTTVLVAFDTKDEMNIIACFAAPQPIDQYPFQDGISTSDPRWRTYHSAQAPFLQAYLPPPDSAE